MPVTKKRVITTHKHTKKSRSSPTESATQFPEGTIKKGNNMQYWVIKRATNGTQRWQPLSSAPIISGIAPLTVDYLAKNIGKTITIYETEYMGRYPAKTELSGVAGTNFTPSGDAMLKNKLIPGWLKNQKPAIPDRVIFSIQSAGDELSLQVDSINKKLVSSNVMNMLAWVKTN